MRQGFLPGAVLPVQQKTGLFFHGGVDLIEARSNGNCLCSSKDHQVWGVLNKAGRQMLTWVRRKPEAQVSCVVSMWSVSSRSFAQSIFSSVRFVWHRPRQPCSSTREN